jgi:iron complex outermembrane recepter protein
MHMTARRAAWIRSTVLLQAGAVLYTAPALAQPEAANNKSNLVVEEVLVTATKRSEPLQDVPLAVSAITAEDIQARGLTQFSDYLNSVPGVYFTDNGPGVSQIRIRGLTAAEGGLASTTASYFGETVTSVLTNKGGKPNLRLVDIDRVEVLRGPQGTLFGANALAGVLRIIPAAPDPTKFQVNLGTRGFTTAHSSDESYHIEGTVNFPIVQDRLALRLVGYKDEIAGYIDNEVAAQPSVDYSAAFGAPDGTLVTPAVNAFTRKDINSEDTWGMRAALQWRATDQLKFDLSHIVQDVTLNSEPHASPSVGEYAQNRALDVFEPGGVGERLDVTALVAEYDWEKVSLVSASNWVEMNRFFDQDITFLAALSFGGAPVPWGLNDKSWGKLFTQELRLQSRGETPLQWLMGVFYLKQDADLSQFVPDYSCPACLPQLVTGDDFALDFRRQRFSEQRQQSVFGDISYALTSQWTVGAGARYLEEDLTSIDGVSTGLLAPPPGDAPREGSVYELNPSAYVRFKPVESMTFYAQAGRGFRSGIVNSELPDFCQAELQAVGGKPLTDPDTLNNYEVGLKSRLAGGRLGLNTALFKQKWKGVQLGVVFDCGFSTIINGGDVTGDGIELELDAQPIESWRFNLALSYVKNEFDTVAAGSGFSPGERLPDAPEKNASVGAQYDFPLGSAWAGFARADYLYVGDVRVKDPLGDITQDSFTVANLRVGFQKDNLALELFGRNLGDERAVMSTSPRSFGGNQVLLRPREVGVEVRYSFR